jgi:hypothetical protein
VLSEVSPATVRALAEGLRPAPRAIADRMQILAVEDGRFELTIGRAPGRENSTILLAPAAHSRLFDALLPLARQGARATGPAGADVFILLKDGALAALSGRPFDDGGAPRYLALTATADDGGWRARLVASSATLWGSQEALPVIESWSVSAFEALQDGALAAAMGVSAPPARDGGSGWLTLARLVPVPGGMDGLLAGRAAVVVRADGERPAPMAGAAPDARAPAAEPRLSVSIAVEASDMEKLVEQGDRCAAAIYMRLEAGPGSGPVELGDVLLEDDAVREMRLGAGLAPGLAKAFGGQPALSWGFARSPRQPRGGWFILSLSPWGAATIKENRAHLAAERTDAKALPRVSVGVIRPARLARFLGDLDPGRQSALGSMKWIESIRWDAWLEGGAVEGAIDLRMTAP